MNEIVDRRRCTGCSACVSACPVKCIKMELNSNGFYYPSINNKTCINCKRCINTCPVIGGIKSDSSMLLAFATKNKDNYIRSISTSGGFFYSLAKFVIEEGGVVFGATCSSDLVIRHVVITSLDEIYELQGSKYVQSDINNSYINAKHYLDEGKKVLFSGTPCQIAGLIKYVGSNYQNLITQDIICHGVPSPEYWRQYCGYIEKKENSKIINYEFRNKKYGWRDYAIRFELSNRKVLTKLRYDDAYMQSFLKNYILRPSCYECQFKTVNRMADITLADFWTINNYCSGFDDNLGTSLVFIHSEKGQNIFASIKRDIEFVPIPSNQVANSNMSMVQSSNKPKDYETFNSILKKDGWDGITKLFFKESFFTKFTRNFKIVIKSKLQRLGGNVKL